MRPILILLMYVLVCVAVVAPHMTAGPATAGSTAVVATAKTR